MKFRLTGAMGLQWTLVLCPSDCGALTVSCGHDFH